MAHSPLLKRKANFSRRNEKLIKRNNKQIEIPTCGYNPFTYHYQKLDHYNAIIDFLHINNFVYPFLCYKYTYSPIPSTITYPKKLISGSSTNLTDAPLHLTSWTQHTSTDLRSSISTTSPALPLNVPTFILAILNRRLSSTVHAVIVLYRWWPLAHLTFLLVVMVSFQQLFFSILLFVYSNLYLFTYLFHLL